jgi:hypothetical protein
MNWEPATAPGFFDAAKTPAEESAAQLGVPDPVASSIWSVGIVRSRADGRFVVEFRAGPYSRLLLDTRYE